MEREQVLPLGSLVSGRGYQGILGLSVGPVTLSASSWEEDGLITRAFPSWGWEHSWVPSGRDWSPPQAPLPSALSCPPCWLCSYLTLLRSVSPSSKVGHLSSLQLESCPALSCSGDTSGEFCPAWLPYAGPVYNLTSHTARREEVGPVQSSRIVTAVCPFLKSHLLLWGRASNNGVRERRQATPSSWIVIVHWPVCPALFRM